MRAWLGDVLRRFRREAFPGCTNVVEIETGGFSTIYRASQPQFGRTVAIKVLDPRRLNRQHLRRRFERECKAQGMLGEHPNVVSIFHANIGKSGEPYIVMEYLRAGSLADRVKAGSLSWQEVLTIGVKLAGALESAHKAGVLHRDVKPGNVLIGQEAEPKLADFGIARLRDGRSVLTETSEFSPGWAAPEVLEGDPPTESSDVYSLGATLFTLLAGHLPFLRSVDEEVGFEVWIGRVLFEPIPDLRPLGVPDRLCAVVETAMAKRVADRYGSAAELGEALQAVQREHGLQPTSMLVVPVTDTELRPLPDPPSPPPWRVALCSLLVVAFVVGVVLVVFRRATCTPLARPADSILSFGTLFPKTGTFSFGGPAMQAGARLAIDDVEAAGGVFPGITVRLDEANQLDDGGGTERSRESADALVSNGVDVIIGPGISAAAVKVIDVAVCAGAIMFSPSTASPVFSDYPDHGLYFRAAASDVLRAPWLGGLVVADGNATVVLISRDDTWGNHLRQLTAQVIERAGVRVLDSFSYRPDTADHKGDVGRIKAKNPDAIVLIGLNDSAPILAEMIKEGLGPRDKRVYGASNLTNNLARLVDPQNPGVLAGMRGVNVDDGNDAFTSRMRAIDPGLQSFTLGAEAYDAVVVTALAAVSAGTDAPTTVAAHINEVTRGGVKCASYADCRRLILEGKDVDYDGASGPLDFTDAGEPSSVGYVIKEFQADGTVKALRAVKASLPG